MPHPQQGQKVPCSILQLLKYYWQWKTNPACNMKLVNLKCTYLKNIPRYVLLIAKQKIEPLEQLTFDYLDYMDPKANRNFDGNAE